MDLILTHSQTDFDGLGAMVAAKRLYPRAQAALAPQLTANVRRFVRLHQDAFGLLPLAEIDLTSIDRIILVDTQDPSRAGLPLPEGLPLEIWDHHPPYVQPDQGEVKPVGAATTLLTHALMRQGCGLTPIEATAMLLGIYADTGRLSFPSTTPEDLEAATFLLRQGAQLELVGEFLESTLTEAQQRLMMTMLDRAERFPLPGGEGLLVALRWEEPASDLSGLAGKLIDLTGSDLTVLAVETPDGEGARLQLVARTDLRHVDLRDLLSPWNPKGHPRACSAHAEDVSAEAVLPILRERLSRVIPHEPSARDLMSHPVRTLDLDTSVAEAAECMARFGHSAFPVLYRGKPQGVIARRDLDRARTHGRETASIRSLFARRIEAVSPEAPLSEIEERMVRGDIGRLLVMEDGQLVGIVTRSDVLRARYELHGPRTDHPLAGNLTGRLQETWPRDWVALLDAVGSLADSTPTYLVGGAVRDLLLGQSNLDVDLVVEGDAIALAQALVDRMGGMLKPHEAFGTAHVTLPDGKRVEFARSRIEHYPVAGGLPVVEPATLKQDLSRRDFTVNALAMRVGGPSHGQLVDYFGGLEDLSHRRLTILHSLSFIEDPTRILRAARFELQLPGFRMDPQTEAFARYALSSSRFDGLSSSRVKGELRRALEALPLLAFARRLEDLDAWRMVDAGLHLERRAACALAQLDRMELAGHDRWLLALGAILLPLERSRREAILRTMHLSRSEVHLLGSAWDLAEVPAQEERSLDPASFARRLDAMPDLALDFMHAIARSRPRRQRLAEYRQRLRGIKLTVVDGEWLKARGVPPGPVYRRILEELLDARRAGTIRSVEDEVREAEGLMARYNGGSRPGGPGHEC